MSYARGTVVPVERSQVELERMLIAHGASGFYRGFDGQRVVIGFKFSDRLVKFELPLPQLDTDSRTRRYGKEAATRRLEQATRERWRALVLSVKAKLISVESGVESFEEAFLAHVVTADGKTVHQHVAPTLKEIYTSGKNLPLLPGMGQTTGAP